MMLDDHPTLDVVLRLGLAFVLGIPLGWEREKHSRSGGLRTYPLLSACVCGFLLAAHRAGWAPREEADAFYGVLSGIGFVGSSAIVKSPEGAGGMTTAVSLWVTGAIGAGVAHGGPFISSALSLLTMLALYATSLVRPRRGTSS